MAKKEDYCGVYYDKRDFRAPSREITNPDSPPPPEFLTKAVPLDTAYQAYDEASGEWAADPDADEIEALAKELAALQSELDGKDYKVLKASEAGEVLAESDPALHKRRNWCRNRINEARERLTELNA